MAAACRAERVKAGIGTSAAKSGAGQADAAGRELCAHTFVFDHPWDMERCLTPHTMETMDWNQVFNDDEEWTFMLNRMDYWSALAKAALVSQDTRYLDQAKDFLLDWIEQHPRIEPSLSTRTLDTGIRVVNMLNARCF